MKRTSYPKVNYDEGAKQLFCDVILESAKDYCDPDASPQKKGAILKNLRKNNLLNGFTNDLGINTAEQLELHSDEIAERLGIIKEEDEELLC